MKKIALLFALALAAIAAVGPTYTQQYSYVQLWNCTPAYTDGQTLSASVVSSSLTGHFVNDADPTDAHDLTVSNFSFDLMDEAHASKTVTYDKVTVTYAQLSGLMNAACTQEGAVQIVADKAARAVKANP